MGASYSVKGVLPPSEKFEKMKKIYELCKENDIKIPDEIEEFFDLEDPTGKSGMEVDIEYWIERSETTNYYFVKVDSIPNYITHIKFCISYWGLNYEKIHC